MAKVIKICDRCKKINVYDVIGTIKELDDTIEVDVGCCNFCGICRSKAFIILDNIPIIKETEKELIEEIRRRLKKGE